MNAQIFAGTQGTLDNKNNTRPEPHHRPSQAAKRAIRAYFTDTLKGKRLAAIGLYDTLLEISIDQFQAGSKCLASYREIAQAAGCSVNLVKEVLDHLVKLGLIEDQPGQTPKHPHTFIIRPAHTIKLLDETNTSPVRHSKPIILLSGHDNKEDGTHRHTTAKSDLLSPHDSKNETTCQDTTDGSLGEASPSASSVVPRITIRKESVEESNTNRMIRGAIRLQIKSIHRKLFPEGAGATGADVTRGYKLFEEALEFRGEEFTLDLFIQEMRNACDITFYRQRRTNDIANPIGFFFGVLKKTLFTEAIGNPEITQGPREENNPTDPHNHVEPQTEGENLPGEALKVEEIKKEEEEKEPELKEGWERPLQWQQMWFARARLKVVNSLDLSRDQEEKLLSIKLDGRAGRYWHIGGSGIELTADDQSWIAHLEWELGELATAEGRDLVTLSW